MSVDDSSQNADQGVSDLESVNTDLSSIISDPSLGTKITTAAGNIIRRVLAKGTTKNAVIQMLQNEPNDESTDTLCLHLLRVLDDPTILVSAVDAKDKADAKNKSNALTLSQLKQRIIIVLLSLAISGGTLLATVLAKFLG